MALRDSPSYRSYLKKKYRFYGLKCLWWDLQRKLFHPANIFICGFFLFFGFWLALGFWLEGL